MRNFQKLMGRCPRPRWGAYSAPQTPSWIGLTSLAETTLKGVLRTPLRAAGRISCLGFLWDRGLREEAKGGRQFVSGSC